MAIEIADRWFERKRIDSDVTWLWEPAVDPLLRCNIWHVRGREFDLMIDTGLGISSLRQAAHDLLDKKVRAVATHTHYDHIGGHHEFEHCYCHPAEIHNLKNASVAEFTGLRRQDIPGHIVDLIEQSGYPIPNVMLTALPNKNYRIEDYRLHDFKGLVTSVDQGDIIDLGNRVFEVLHLPGHSPGSIGLWEEKTGTLFSGDAVYDGPLIDNLPGADKGDYIATLEKILTLDVSVVHAGHEPSFGGERLNSLVREALVSWGA
jgi:glyoxylase-like metal-dependent hydrolase (beta-lactamase superfamily II)